jgi:hypothetical protein
MFWKKKEKPIENVNPSIETRFTKLEAEVLALAVAQDVIRNKVLRKIQFKKKEEEEEEEEEDTNSAIPFTGMKAF